MAIRGNAVFSTPVLASFVLGLEVGKKTKTGSGK